MASGHCLVLVLADTIVNDHDFSDTEEIFRNIKEPNKDLLFTKNKQ